MVTSLDWFAEICQQSYKRYHDDVKTKAAWSRGALVCLLLVSHRVVGAHLRCQHQCHARAHPVASTISSAYGCGIFVFFSECVSVLNDIHCHRPSPLADAAAGLQLTPLVLPSRN